MVDAALDDPALVHFRHAMAYRAGAYNEHTPSMHEIRVDGINP